MSYYQEFRAIEAIVKSLEKNWPKLKADTRDWLRKRINEIIDSGD